MLRWGIVGTGFISHTVIDAIADSDGSTAVVVAGRTAERVAEFQKQHGIPSGTTDVDSVLTDPSVDAIYVGLPNHVHHDVTHNERLELEMRRRSGRTSVPQIFVDGAHVGGFDDLVAAERSGELDALLATDPTSRIAALA